MSSSGAVSIQSARLSQIGVNRQILKEGSSVLVRVIADRGGGKYEGSVAGVRVQLTSSKPLQAGDSFAATISVKKGLILVTPKDISGMAGLQGAGEIALQFNEVSQSQLFSLLESLGLPADNLSSSILQSFKQMGLKMDSVLANKIRSLALRFTGKEKSAAEVLSLLAQKGIEADEDEIKALLTFLESEEGSGPGRNLEKEIPSHNKKSKDKLINRINSTEGAWYFLPFEMVEVAESLEENRHIFGKGCLRLLFDAVNSLKLLNLDCVYDNRRYLFSLSYDRNQIKNTYFNVIEDGVKTDTEDKVKELKKHFMTAGINPGKIIWTDKEVLEGSASGLESFVSFGGEI